MTTFFQTLVDVKNAQVPGTYQASGHDYRPDLPRLRQRGLRPAGVRGAAGPGAEAVRQREEARWQVFQED